MSWLENLKEARAAKGVTNKWISEHSLVPKSTVDRTFTGKNSPSVATLDPICQCLDTTLESILHGTRTVISAHDIPELQDRIEQLTTTIENLTIKLDNLTAENELLKEQVCHFKSEASILQVKLELKDEIIATHNYYIKKQN